MAKTKWPMLQKRHDRAKVFEYISNFPAQCKQAIEIGKKFNVMQGTPISRIVICGMGGSGIAGRIIKGIVEKEISVPIEIVADYSLPNFVDANTLVITVSFSGNTEETIACFEDAKKREAKIVGITSNGRLSELCEQKIVVSKAPQPRMALGSLAVPLLFVLSNYNLIASKEKELLHCTAFLEKERQSIETEAKKTAERIFGKFPVVYAQSRFEALAYRFRCDINENAKQLALHHVIPEMNHNEINAEILPSKPALVLIRNLRESEKIKKRFEFTKKTFKKMPLTEIWLKGSSRLEETFYGIFILDMASYYLALLNKKDPNEIPVIKKMHREMDLNK